MANFDRAFDAVIGVEGGYVNNSADRGGPTNWGITQATYSSWLRRPASAADVKAMPKSTAKEIYFSRYWSAMSLDRIEDQALAEILFDQGVNRGTGTAVIELQGVLNRDFNKGVSTDGKMGPQTLMAIESVDRFDLLNKFIQNAQDDYVAIVKNNNSQMVFLAGWINRSQKLLDRVFDEVRLIKDAAKAPLPVKEQPDMEGWAAVVAKAIEMLLGLFGADNQKETTPDPESPVPSKYKFAFDHLLDTGVHSSKALESILHWAGDTQANWAEFIDMGKHDETKRAYLFSLKDQSVEVDYVSHGKKSDPDDDGYATKFSNVSGSNMTSLGRYLCAETYMGGSGYSMRLDGLDPSNSNARGRYIVQHPSDYVPGGRSLGCPALRKAIAKRWIDCLKNGSPLYIYHPSMVEQD